MRRRTKISIEPKYILAFFTVLCLILIFVSFKYSDKLEPVRSTVGSIFAPMQKGINSLGTTISKQFENFKSVKQLQTANEQLKEELNNVTYENKILQQDKYELESLRKLFVLDSKYAGYPKVAARVISGDVNNWYPRFTIDKGTDDGLAVGMNVMAGNGLVGIIVEARHNHSIVRSVIDDKSSVGGMFLKTKDTCMVTGDLKLIDKGLIQVTMISKDAKIKEGYEVVTSNVSDKYLQGILIGYIRDITMDSNNMTMSGYLTPAADFNRLDTVLVITQLEEGLK